jgi:hypothetical protein
MTVSFVIASVVINGGLPLPGGSVTTWVPLSAVIALAASLVMGAMGRRRWACAVVVLLLHAALAALLSKHHLSRWAPWESVAWTGGAAMLALIAWIGSTRRDERTVATPLVFMIAAMGSVPAFVYGGYTSGPSYAAAIAGMCGGWLIAMMFARVRPSIGAQVVIPQATLAAILLVGVHASEVTRWSGGLLLAAPGALLVSHLRPVRRMGRWWAWALGVGLSAALSGVGGLLQVDWSGSDDDYGYYE